MNECWPSTRDATSASSNEASARRCGRDWMNAAPLPIWRTSKPSPSSSRRTSSSRRARRGAVERSLIDFPRPVRSPRSGDRSGATDPCSGRTTAQRQPDRPGHPERGRDRSRAARAAPAETRRPRRRTRAVRGGIRRGLELSEGTTRQRRIPAATVEHSLSLIATVCAGRRSGGCMATPADGVIAPASDRRWQSRGPAGIDRPHGVATRDRRSACSKRRLSGGIGTLPDGVGARRTVGCVRPVVRLFPSHGRHCVDATRPSAARGRRRCRSRSVFSARH